MYLKLLGGALLLLAVLLGFLLYEPKLSPASQAWISRGDYQVDAEKLLAVRSLQKRLEEIPTILLPEVCNGKP